MPRTPAHGRVYEADVLVVVRVLVRVMVRVADISDVGVSWIGGNALGLLVSFVSDVCLGVEFTSATKRADAASAPNR